jgi:hypothetical protein
VRKRGPMTNLANKDAFPHVVDSHRWLAASGCAWNLVGPNATGAAKNDAHRLLPNIDVMVRDCLLLHARSLLNFYTDHTNRKRDCTDILLRDYGISKRPMVEGGDGSLQEFNRAPSTSLPFGPGFARPDSRGRLSPHDPSRLPSVSRARG